MEIYYQFGIDSNKKLIIAVCHTAVLCKVLFRDYFKDIVIIKKIPIHKKTLLKEDHIENHKEASDILLEIIDSIKKETHWLDYHEVVYIGDLNLGTRDKKHLDILFDETLIQRFFPKNLNRIVVSSSQETVDIARNFHATKPMSSPLIIRPHPLPRGRSDKDFLSPKPTGHILSSDENTLTPELNNESNEIFLSAQSSGHKISRDNSSSSDDSEEATPYLLNRINTKMSSSYEDIQASLNMQALEHLPLQKSLAEEEPKPEPTHLFSYSKLTLYQQQEEKTELPNLAGVALGCSISRDSSDEGGLELEHSNSHSISSFKPL